MDNNVKVQLHEILPDIVYSSIRDSEGLDGGLPYIDYGENDGHVIYVILVAVFGFIVVCLCGFICYRYFLYYLLYDQSTTLYRGRSLRAIETEEPLAGVHEVLPIPDTDDEYDDGYVVARKEIDLKVTAFASIPSPDDLPTIPLSPDIKSNDTAENKATSSTGEMSPILRIQKRDSNMSSITDQLYGPTPTESEMRQYRSWNDCVEGSETLSPSNDRKASTNTSTLAPYMDDPRPREGTFTSTQTIPAYEKRKPPDASAIIVQDLDPQEKRNPESILIMTDYVDSGDSEMF